MKKCFRFFAVLFLLSAEFTFAFNQETIDLNALGSSHEDFHTSDYYTVKVDPRVAVIDLMNFDHFQTPLPYPTEPYDRLTQFGGWIDYPGDNLCLNTRSKVLVRETKAAVTYSPNGCTVQTGVWVDPYTTNTYTTSKEIQIDHLVPLKNAYMTGAYEWDHDKRCLYANYMGNKFHLLAVDGTQNMSKGESSPAIYMPPNKQYSCQYLKEWLQVKVIWSLRLTPGEVDGIRSEFQKANCDRADFKMTATALTAQKQFMDDNKDLCSRASRNYN